MGKAESFSIFYFVAEFPVFFIHHEKSIQITVVGIFEPFAYVAGFFLFLCPDADGTALGGIFFQLAHQRRFLGDKGAELVMHLLIHMQKMGFQYPSVSEGVAIIEHFFKMASTESGLIRGFTDIAFHIRRAGA